MERSTSRSAVRLAIASNVSPPSVSRTILWPSISREACNRIAPPSNPTAKPEQTKGRAEKPLKGVSTARQVSTWRDPMARVPENLRNGLSSSEKTARPEEPRHMRAPP